MVQVQSFSIEQGLSDRNLNTITKDQQGFLWIGTDNGLNRFDGYDFLTYDSRPRNKHQVRFNKIYSILNDRSGKLLITYHYLDFGEFDVLDPLTGRTTKINIRKGEGFQGKYSAVFQSPDGAIYFHTVPKKGQVVIYAFDEAKLDFVKVLETRQPDVDENCFASFLKAADGTFWFAYNWESKDPIVIHSDARGQTLNTYGAGHFSLTPGDSKGWVALTETKGGEIWFTLYTHGVYTINPAGDGVFKRQPQLPPAGYFFARDKLGNLLAYQLTPPDPTKGCFLITANGQLINYSWIFEHQSIIDAVYSDDFTKGLVAGSGNGFNNYRLRTGRFSTFLNKDLGKEPYGISVRGICKSGKDKLFIATELNGLYELDLKTNALVRPGDRLPGLAPLNQMKYPRNLLSQGDSVLWIACLGGVFKYNHAQHTLDLYKSYSGRELNGNDEVWGTVLNKEGNIWIITRDGRLMKLDPATNDMPLYRDKDGKQPLEKTQPSFILSARNGTLWIGTMVAGLVKINLEKGENQHFTANPGDPSGFNSNHITCIYEDAGGLLWVGTMEGGLHVFDPAKGKVTAIYSRENGLRNNSAVGLLPDDKGNYWVSTFSGLSYFDTKLKTFRNYTTADGLSHNEFNRFSYFFDQDNGRFYFGGMNGVNVFDQVDPQAAANDAPLLVSEMSVTGQGDNVFVQQEGILDGSTITLAPGSRFLRLRLALGTYYDPAGNQFSYKIDGLDKDWNYLGTNRELRIDRLPAGTYTLQLRGADEWGNWSSRELHLHLVVQQFWYKRWWAYLLYAGLIGAAGFYFYRFQLSRRIAEKEAHRLQELDTFKTRFFTNISHEFRTPLTVILGMVESLKKDAKPEQQQAAEMVRRNSRQLLDLVNQLLDLSRLESGKLKLSPANGDLVAFLNYQLESFQSFAETRHVGLYFQSEIPELPMAFDHEKIQTMLVNLISNAIKFTPEGGRIDLRLTVDGGREMVDNGPSTVNRQPFAVIQITDTGIGIPEDHLSRIFDRFYQVDDSMTRKGEGTGIGLALVQELAKLMQGTITVASTPGKGTTFRITLPYTPPLSQLQSFAGYTAHTSDFSPEQQMIQNESSAEDDGRPLLLIVEDNPDVRYYIAECVKNEYRVIVAANGAEGIQNAKAQIPDIIISDVMMPEKDGFELCETLKNDEHTSHIPIVLLTARADFDSRIAGLRRGADDYLAKPFEPAELQIRLENLVNLRRRLQQRYAGLALPQVPSEDPDLVLEDAFLLKIRAVVEAHLSETDFDMPQLEQALGMSRSQVFRKVKALTGASPSVLIRSIRLQKAKTLLRGSTLTIAEIAYEVGFSTPAYFSTSFLEEYGLTPSAWREG